MSGRQHAAVSSNPGSACSDQRHGSLSMDGNMNVHYRPNLITVASYH